MPEPSFELVHYMEAPYTEKVDVSDMVGALWGLDTFIERHQALTEYPSFILRREGEAVAVGSIDFSRNDNKIELENIAVDPKVQGQGIGKVLVGLLEEQALAITKKPSIDMFVKSSITGYALYQALGYVPSRDGKNCFQKTIHNHEIMGA